MVVTTKVVTTVETVVEWRVNNQRIIHGQRDNSFKICIGVN